jgi:DNA-binding NtrC family response regulator
MRILVVDDDVEIRNLLYNYLSQKHELSVLTDGRNAVSLLSDVGHGFDLVFMDLNMPRMTGEEVLNVIESLPDVKTRFVVISAYPDRYRRVVEIGSKVIGMLEKPFRLGAVEQMIAAAARSRPEPRSKAAQRLQLGTS